MAKNRVEVTMTVAQANAVNQWLAAQKGPAQFFDSLEKGGQKGKKSTDQLGKSLAGWGPAMVGAATGALSFNAALSAGQKLAALIRADLERIRDLQNEAAQKSVTFEDALQGLVRVVPKSAGKSVKDLEKQIKEGTEKTGVAPEVLAQVATKTVSAGLGTTIDERIEMAIAAAEFAPELRTSPEGIGAIATAAQGFLKNFRGEFSADMGTAIREAVAMVAAASSASRVESIDQFAKYGGAAINQSAAFGVSLEDAIALQAAIGTRSDDSDGTLTRTAMINLLEQSLEIVKRIGIARGEEVKGKDGAPIRGMEMIEFIRSAPEARGELAKLLGAHTSMEDAQEFLESGVLKPNLRRGLRTRAPQLVPLLELFSPDSTAGDQDTKALFESAKTDVLAPSEALANEMAKQRESRSRAGSLAQQGELAKERIRTGVTLDPALATQGKVQEILDTLLKDSGQTTLLDDIRKPLTTAMSRGKDPAEVLRMAELALQARQVDIREGRTGTLGFLGDVTAPTPFGLDVGMMSPVSTAFRAGSQFFGEGADSQKQLDLLQRAVDELAAMRAGLAQPSEERVAIDRNASISQVMDALYDIASDGGKSLDLGAAVTGAAQGAGTPREALDAAEAVLRDAQKKAEGGSFGLADLVREAVVAASPVIDIRPLLGPAVNAERTNVEQLQALNGMLAELSRIRERLTAPTPSVPREVPTP